jgi:hypothetical protein
MGILADLLPLMDATVVAQPGVLDGAGTWLASGGNASYRCRYEGGPQLVRDAAGQEVVSSLLCIVGGVLVSHDPSIMRFDITSPFQPHRLEVQALRIEPISDETGVIFAEVYFL